MELGHLQDLVGKRILSIRCTAESWRDECQFDSIEIEVDNAVFEFFASVDCGGGDAWVDAYRKKSTIGGTDEETALGGGSGAGVPGGSVRE